MAETVINTKTLPEILAKLIPTEKVRISRTDGENGEIRLVPLQEADEVDNIRLESKPVDNIEMFAETTIHKVEDDNPAPNFIGIFSKYANPSLIPLEKEAWGMAVKEKHEQKTEKETTQKIS